MRIAMASAPRQPSCSAISSDPIHQARHIAAIRALQMETGGFTEFVPLPFVHMESPMFKRGQARMGPTWRETLLLHAVARIALHGAIGSIQTSWVKLGAEGAAACLSAGCNDLGGVLMNESISRAAGAAHGQEMSVDGLERIAALAGRPLERRTTLYDRVAVVSRSTHSPFVLSRDCRSELPKSKDCPSICHFSPSQFSAFSGYSGRTVFSYCPAR
jgi:2-iminoacetate synthase ThiH